MKPVCVSVVIPAYNEQGFIEKTLKSLQKQDYKQSFEVIVVDNGSKDQTAEIAKKHGAVVICETKKGVQFARQAGFKAAKGKYIASTDADTVLPQNWLSKMAKALQKDQNLVAVGGWFHHESGSFSTRIIINHFSKTAAKLYKNTTQKSVLSGANFMVKKSAFQKTDGFEEFTSINEDLLLAQKLAKHGEIKTHFKKSWSVSTSHRKWTNGFIKASLPYIINGLAYAFVEKIVVKNLSDSRSEQINTNFRPKIVLAATAVLFFVFLYIMPVAEVDAKIDPIAKKTQEKIIEDLQEFKNEHFVH